MRPIRIVGKVIGVMMVIALVSLGFGYVVRELWNWLIPGIFHLGVITFWQAVGLIILCRLLFRGFGGGHWKHRHWGHQHDGRWGYWKDRLKDMTPEEKAEMKERWKGGWHDWKNRWRDMSPEERDKMKAQWKERCRNWESRRAHPIDFLSHEEEEMARKKQNTDQ